MPSFEGLLVGGTLLLLVLGGLGLVAALRRSAATPATDALGEGRFAEALERGRSGPGAARDELFTMAVAAKHLLDFDRADFLLERILAPDLRDGEAWLERGLVAAYAALAPAAGTGERLPAAAAAAADQALSRALEHRSDLAESITLHRAWLALKRGDPATARRLFDEVEASLETKLRSDLGAGEPLFAEWFLHAATLWQAFGEEEKARWAFKAARETAPHSRLPELLDPRGA